MTLLIFLRILCVLFILALLLGPDLHCFLKETIKLTKQDLADYYRVSRKTLSKWVVNFSDYNREKWTEINGKARLSLDEFLKLQRDFGDGVAYSKQRLANEMDTYYKKAGNYARYFFEEELGISGGLYKSIDKLPPKLSLEIIDGYKREF